MISWKGINLMYKLKGYFSRINIAAVISAIYFSFVWMIYIYTYISSNKKFTLVFTLFILVSSYFAFNFLLNKISNIENLGLCNFTCKQKLCFFFIVAFIVFLIRLVWILAFWPGGWSTDPITQYKQAITGNYDDWHPVWHTILFFTIPLKIFNNLPSIVILQNVYFSLVLAYMALTLIELWNIKASLLLTTWIVFNPIISQSMLFLWKDVAFMLSGTLCFIISIKLILKHKSSDKLWKLILLGVLLSWTTIFRHNAILFTIPLIILLCFHLNKKILIKIIFVFFVSLLLIKVVLYSFLNVKQPGSRVVESMGIPLTIIGNVVTSTPERLDEELSQFAYSLLPKEEWAKGYKCGSFNSVKYNTHINKKVINDKGYLGMINLMFKCFYLSPQASFKALFSLTNFLYSFEDGGKDYISVSIIENDLSVSHSNIINPAWSELLNFYKTFISKTIFKYFINYGVILIVVLVAVLSKLKFNSWNSWKNALVIAPIFCYDFGTMCFLTGPEYIPRFFLITYLIAPLIIAFAFYKKDKTNENILDNTIQINKKSVI